MKSNKPATTWKKNHKQQSNEPSLFPEEKKTEVLETGIENKGENFELTDLSLEELINIYEGDNYDGK